MLDEIATSIRQLHDKLDQQGAVLQEVADLRLIIENDSLPHALARARERENELSQAILMAISVLEGTKKNFRSRQLEQLRLHLIGVVAQKSIQF